jgi:hypothetical protein
MDRNHSGLGKILRVPSRLGDSDAIASILLHKNEPNKMYSESTKKDEKIGPILNLIAQSV